MKINYKKTIYASFIGFITQAIVNNFAPPLFLTFTKNYHISLSGITMVTTVNFAVQLITDFLAIGFVDKIGYKWSAVLAHVLAGVGLISMAVLPDFTPHPLGGILSAVIIYAVGGGLLEVIMSPIVEACPTDNKEKAMSMLHSFYSWGQVGVILISTLFFFMAGISNWKIMAIVWAVIPLCNAVFFAIVPVPPMVQEGEARLGMGGVLKNKIFWLFALLMMCAGASEQAVSQWASSFAESSLGVSKTLGDIAGPMFFGVTMGATRTIYGKYGEKIKLQSFIIGSVVLCIFSYLLIGLSPVAAIGLIGCGICGMSVGVLWPGTFSMAAAGVKGGGTAMFALLALAGDLGCSFGPTVVGTASDFFGNNLKIGILTAIIFPAVLLVALLMSKNKLARKEA